MRPARSAEDMKHALVERLMHYYHFVSERLEQGNEACVTSTEIAELIHMDATLVRKDLAALGVRGAPHVGYKSADVLQAIRDALGFDQPCRGVIIGVGRLGSAMALYRGFARYGLQLCGLFDSDPAKTGVIAGGQVVLPLSRLARVVEQHRVEIAIITVPAEAAQEVANLVVSAGVRAIWSFASTNITVPEGVFVRHEHLSVGLAELSYYLKESPRL